MPDCASGFALDSFLLLRLEGVDDRFMTKTQGKKTQFCQFHNVLFAIEMVIEILLQMVYNVYSVYQWNTKMAEKLFCCCLKGLSESTVNQKNLNVVVSMEEITKSNPSSSNDQSHKSVR